MIFQIESFLCPDKQETSEEVRKIQQPKRCVISNNNKDENNSPKNHIRDHKQNNMKVIFKNQKDLENNKKIQSGLVLISWHINLCRLFNSKAALLEEPEECYLTNSWEDKRVNTFPKGICPIVNVIARWGSNSLTTIPQSSDLTITPPWQPPVAMPSMPTHKTKSKKEIRKASNHN